MANNIYNPDVLNCIANLSNDEVFTPPELANKMLDLLPQELFSSPKTTFLDPFTKSGVFLREIVKRLDRGLEKQMPDRQQRIDHILHKQVFGIACTELTSLLSRRSVYCSKFANGKYSISKFNTEEGNILYRNIQHTWVNGKCKYCGASQSVYDRGSEAEQYAYMFIHTDNPNKFFNNMKFDVIVGNPPYQMEDGGGTGDSAKPIYHLFFQQAKEQRPNYITMVVPSRWMKGGKGLSSFRQEMMEDKRFSYMYDFENANECFPGVHIDGGICYFLWCLDYHAETKMVYKAATGEEIKSYRFLKTEFSETVIRDPRQISIISKVSKAKTDSFSSLVFARNPYGLGADIFNSPENYDFDITKDYFTDACKVYGVQGKKGGAKRVVGYIKKEDIPKSNIALNKHKLFFSKAYMTTSTVPPEIIKGLPNDICSETFLQIGGFDNEEEMDNCLNYIKTKFFRALLFFNRHSLNLSRESFDSIPLISFSHPWTDEMLYKKYGLTQEEIAFIESMIRPME